MRVHLVQLPADATTADPTVAVPLGSRQEVAARIAELLPGVVFDEGYGTFRRASYELILTIHGAEPTAVDVLFDKPEGLAALKRVVDKTGWRAIDPSAKTFVDLEASQAAKALVAATPGKSRAAAPAAAAQGVSGTTRMPVVKVEAEPSLEPNPVLLVASWALASVLIAFSYTVALPVPTMFVAPILAAAAQWAVMLRQVTWSREWAIASGLQALIYLVLVQLVGDGSSSSASADPFVPLVAFVVSSIPQAVFLWDRAARPLVWAASRPIHPLLAMALAFGMTSAVGGSGAFAIVTTVIVALAAGIFDAVSFVYSVWSRAFASGSSSLPDLGSARLSGNRLYIALAGVASLVIFAFVTLPLIRDGRLGFGGNDAAASGAGTPAVAARNLNANATAARQAVDTIRDCVERFRSAHPDRGFPARLEQVGPSGEQCLSAEIASGETAGYKFAYNAGVPNASGQVQLYSVCASPASAASGPATFVANQRHTTRVRVSEQRGGGDVCAAAYGDTVAAIEHCATAFAVSHADAGYPATLGDLRSCISTKDTADFRTHSMGDHDYRYTYIAGPADARGVITTFEIYGINKANWAIADQVFANETGVIRVARGQRLPGPGDPTIEDDVKIADHLNKANKVALQEIATPCDAGDQAACAELASRTLEGVRQSLPARDEVAISSAIRLYVTACEARVAPACAGLGEFYTDGKLVPVDMQQGVPPYDKACSMGSAAACHGLASALRRAAAKQAPAAAATSERRALALDERGCKMNDSASCLGLAAALADGRDKSAQARVPTLLETSCRLGDAEGCYRLASFKGNDQRLLLKACARGDFPDCSKLNPPAGSPTSN